MWIKFYFWKQFGFKLSLIFDYQLLKLKQKYIYYFGGGTLVIFSTVFGSLHSNQNYVWVLTSLGEVDKVIDRKFNSDFEFDFIFLACYDVGHTSNKLVFSLFTNWFESQRLSPLPTLIWADPLSLLLHKARGLSHWNPGTVSGSSCVQLFATPWTVAHQVPLFTGFSRQEYWSGLPLPSPGDLSDPGIKPKSLACPALQADSLPSEPPGKLWNPEN